MSVLRSGEFKCTNGSFQRLKMGTSLLDPQPFTVYKNPPSDSKQEVSAGLKKSKSLLLRCGKKRDGSNVGETVHTPW